MLVSQIPDKGTEMMLIKFRATASVPDTNWTSTDWNPWSTLLLHCTCERELISALCPSQWAPVWQKHQQPARELNERRNKGLATEKAAEPYPFQPQHLIPSIPVAAHKELLNFPSAACALKLQQASWHSLLQGTPHLCSAQALHT